MRNSFAQRSSNAVTRAMCARRFSFTCAHAGSSIKSTPDIRLEDRAIADRRTRDVIPPLQLDATSDLRFDNARVWPDDALGTNVGRAFNHGSRIDHRIRTDADVRINPCRGRQYEADSTCL